MAPRMQSVLSTQVPSAIAREVDAVAERMRTASPGWDVTRSDALRYLLLRGLAADRDRSRGT